MYCHSHPCFNLTSARMLWNHTVEVTTPRVCDVNAYITSPMEPGSKIVAKLLLVLPDTGMITAYVQLPMSFHKCVAALQPGCLLLMLQSDILRSHSCCCCCCCCLCSLRFTDDAEVKFHLFLLLPILQMSIFPHLKTFTTRGHIFMNLSALHFRISPLQQPSPHFELSART